MFIQHLLLALFWLLFSLSHSFFAGNKFKHFLQFVLKGSYRYYRFIYSLFALSSLILILIYQSSIQTLLLWQPLKLEIYFSVVMLIISATCMLYFTKKFFFELSGAGVFYKNKNNDTLLSTGLYKYVRHPLYTTTLVFIWSIFLLSPKLNNLIACISITAYTIIGINLEEKKLIQNFGDMYINYRRKTPMLIPKIF